jgi:hypothetical protein
MSILGTNVPNDHESILKNELCTRKICEYLFNRIEMYMETNLMYMEQIYC